MNTSVSKPALIGKNLYELTEIVKSGGMPSFVGKQLAEWIYKKRVADFSEMINISKKNREWLENNYEIGLTPPSSYIKSYDGTIKYAFKIDKGGIVESVFIPDKDRATLCVSSQVGCKMNCYFCATGRLGFKANLSATQIINQILSVDRIQEINKEVNTELTNIVFMGMGEPLDNLPAVLKVIEILTEPWGLAWSPKRITVSSVGKLPQLKELLDKTKVHIAISIHTADIKERESLMPAQKAFPILSVIRMLKAYDFSHQRRLSFEYIMWRGLNDDIRHAEMLADMIKGLDCRVNLIRYHSIPGVELKPASEERMIMFRNFLNSKGIISTIRASRGEDIMAACGMLAGGKDC